MRGSCTCWCVWRSAELTWLPMANAQDRLEWDHNFHFANAIMRYVSIILNIRCGYAADERSRQKHPALGALKPHLSCRPGLDPTAFAGTGREQAPFCEDSLGRCPLSSNFQDEDSYRVWATV